MSPSRARSAAVAAFNRIPVSAILVGLGLFALLVAFVAADPPRGVTGSGSPFTDEAFNAVNARNYVQLGRWSTDQWNLYLVNLPFSLLEALAFKVMGVGIVQARLATIACVSLTAMAIVWGLRSATDRVTAVLAGVAFATSGLVLAYGRLVYVEDLVVLALTLGTLVIVADRRLTWKWGAVSGVCYAIAIGTKPSAIFPAAGIVLALALVRGAEGRSVRRWIFGVLAAVAAAGAVWGLAIWLPNSAAVTMDLRIWAQVHFNIAPLDAARQIWEYVDSRNDHVSGTLLGPLLVFGGAGGAAVVVLRRRLAGPQARLAIASAGWLMVGFGILAVASYRPNRYVVPLVPPLAILAAIGVHLVGGWLTERLRGSAQEHGTESAADGMQPARRRGLPPAHRWAAPAFAAVITLALAAPGLVWYADWARHATYNLPTIQDRLAQAVPEGERVAGLQSALYLMRSGAITIITQPPGGPANASDLYAQGVRWYVLLDNDSPPAGVSTSIWAARERVYCNQYGDGTECLFRLP